MDPKTRDDLVASVRGLRPTLSPAFIACMVDDTLAAIEQRGLRVVPKEPDATTE